MVVVLCRKTIHGDSPKQVHRYIKITDLIPEMLEKVDDGSMEFTPAVQLSYLKANEQKQMLDAMEFAQYVPDIAENWQAQQMIATLIHDMPEAQIEGEISENIQKKIDWIESRDKRADELHQITDKLEKGVKDVFQSDKYKQFLNVMAKFPRYVRQVREWRQQN